VVREIEADTKAFGDDRRTLIEAGKRSVAEIRVVDEPVTVVVSLKGWVRALKGHEVDPAQLAFKAGDALYGTFGCRSVDTCWCSAATAGSTRSRSPRCRAVAATASPSPR
jgi:topoisomerase-4 subunit A